MLYVPPSPRPPITKNDPPLLTQPTSENESSQQDKQIPGPSDVYTYASVTKTSPEETRKSSKSEKRRNRRRALKEQEQNIPDFFTEVSEEESRMDDKLSDENRSKNKEQLSWKLFFKKLKEKIFEEESSSWEDKMKGCGNIILEALISLVLHLIADQPCCNFVKQLWITITYKPT
ncbi:unnamed protein product [Parnassius apollo]|uniref:(apollo) hypothetical protein n=1 Tax=Parnassius apollo TaxID=110799 RepID=A0A8S3WIE4_PARAO|nr:unnamed protein product [Parnassius apollo]